MDEAREGSNYGLREEIEAFWSERAASFDDSVGHEIFSEQERAAWHALLRRHLGPGEGRRALDLASGTGVVSHLLDDLGFAVTGLDVSPAMLERARAKARARGRNIAFRLADAERTMEDQGSFDVVVTRHLVWTLVDPAAAFAEWRRVLKPGGTLLVVDGDFVTVSAPERLLARLEAFAARRGLAGAQAPALAPDLAARHRAILSRVHFRDGARAPAVAALLRTAGFRDIAIDRRLAPIHRAQARAMPLFKGLARRLQHRYAIRARRPD
ncbi:class I SAM-dependent methyltransferase [Aurantimonas sp. Leaf443]|uniref:class I SAM-dependent methyltransferase n=1 Tax=Aurantimonas sp. Leaf443 TaxID=1736378 RepID=UPI0006F8AAC0|nr:class I SAM-dependent methyltransferase [Aurantimonas sp. Leaf443]KQT87131.1 methyltransferase [Aurantimonas sp. Leaf443]